MGKKKSKPKVNTKDLRESYHAILKQGTDTRFQTVRPYSEAREVACREVDIPYKRYGNSWDVMDGQSQFAKCSPDADISPFDASGNRLSLTPAQYRQIAPKLAEARARGRDLAPLPRYA